MESLSDHAIAALATYPGSHNLQSLKHISDPAAESLAKHNEELKLGVTDLTPAAAKSLDGHSHSLSLALETLPVELAQILAEKKRLSDFLRIGGIVKRSSLSAFQACWLPRPWRSNFAFRVGLGSP